MPTEFIESKIANLKAQLQTLHTTRFLQGLIVKDAEVETGDATADANLAQAAKDAAVQIAILTRQIDVREEALATLAAEKSEAQPTENAR